MNVRYIGLLLGAFILLLDLVTKFLVHHALPLMHYGLWYPYGGIGVFKDFFGIEFSIVHTVNKGAAWGAFPAYQQYLLYLRIALVVGMLVYLFFMNKSKEREIPLIMVIAGAIGNILDYFFYGHVVDMMHFVFWGYSYPVFNVADMSITLGILWLCLGSFCKKKAPKKVMRNGYE